MPPSPTTVRLACLGFVFDRHAQALIRQGAPAGFELAFAERPQDMSEAMLAESEVLLVTAPVTDAMMARAPRLRFIQKWGTGYDKIDTEAARRRGIAVAITAGVNADTIAEHAIALMLATLRRIPLADRALREGRWISGEIRPVGQRLYGKTVGIVGFGNIGRAVARQLRGFDGEVLYFTRGGPVAGELAHGARFVPFEELLAQSDIVTLHCPGGAANAGMFDAAALARMKPGATLVNAARGDLVVEADLVAALTSGRLAGAGLDVFAEEPLRADSPLRSLDNVVLTPHSAGSLMDDVPIMAAHAFRNITAFLGGETLPARDVVVPPAAPRAPVSSKGRDDDTR
ncbi:phosphoglycerate dehydrogenase [Ancylobacter sp. MQZ15Z-1]|uniref:Phosphoglycerate dehydrogenase n=1 Tax=Ancylobacter mangrovi TaxID=2972472 RepID=A0A9X2T620_9HYPH|nr:phosphoglycerate dehydrogenase [Ancylobacter mangrovi]MCS0494483.1 phosphoglycerate dehydrogenase [Ancylobacter mangrovi]